MADLEDALKNTSALQPGAVAAFWDGQTHIAAIGYADIGHRAPLAPDAIFRISSLTKPITALALMILLDEQGIALDAPVARWLPELADPKVLRRLDAELDDSEPARRAITVQHVLTALMGIGIVPAPPGSIPIQKAIEGQQLAGFGPPDPAASLDADAWLARLGALPLLAHPGEKWFYSASSVVQGILVSRLSGMPLADFFAERIFAPLGMPDTGFHVPAQKRKRLTPAYSGALAPTDPIEGSAWAESPALCAGDGGLVSTAADYMAFVKMLHGAGPRLIDQAWLDRMFTDHLDISQRVDAAMFLDGRGWGYGLSVEPGRKPPGAGAGTVGWWGGLGTSWLSDLDRNMAVLVFCPRAIDHPDVPAGHVAIQQALLA